jgi:hypothetical protein
MFVMKFGGKVPPGLLKKRVLILESREPGSPVPALFSQGGEEEDEMSPYKCNFTTDLKTLLDAKPTLLR